MQFERHLTFVVRGETKTGRIFISSPEFIEGKQKWACSWSLSFVNPELVRIYGSDPLDAFIRTVDFLSSLIRGNEADGIELYWQEKRDHAGLEFPLSEEKHWEKMRPK